METLNISRAEYELDRQKRLLHTLNTAATVLLSEADEENFEASLLESMELVAGCVDVDRINIWRNETRDGVLHYVLQYVWLSDIGRRWEHARPGDAFPYDPDDDESAKDQQGNASHRLRIDDFLKGKCVNSPFSDLPRDKQAGVEEYGIKSILFIPVFQRESFWGLVSFDDCRRERTFTDDEIGILRSASLMMVSAVNRNAHASQIMAAHGRAKHMLDATPLACSLWDKDICIFDCNEETVRLFELKDKRDFLNRFFDFSPEYQPDGQPSKELAYARARKALEDGRFVFEWTHQLLDGTPLPMEITLVRIDYGDRYILAAYMWDLRQYKRIMKELESALKKAQSANRAKSNFLARMSHEMRTPLNAIIGLSELTFANDDLNMETLSSIEKIYNAGTTLLSTVNDLLDISKIEAGKLELVPGKYDIPSLLNDAVNQSLSYIGEKPIRFILDIDESLPVQLYGDDLKVKQIFNNLLSNAFKYTKKGTVEFGLRCERDGNAVWMTVRVRDSGIGIRPEELSRLFGDYTQIDMGANREVIGTGLGLAITKKLAELMDGSITVESEYGKGSVFTVRIRQKFVADAKIDAETVKNLKGFKYSYRSNFMHNMDSQPASIRLPDARVLVVDDISVNLDVARGMLKPYGMQIDCVTSGQQAIDAIRDEKVRYDAVFMDHMMPGMDGIKAVRIIREEIGTEYAKTVPIIALTANALPSNKKKFLRSGFQDFLSKPVEMARLDAVVRKWLWCGKMEESPGGLHLRADEQALPDGHEENDMDAFLDRRRGMDRRRNPDESIALLDVERGIERFGGDRESYMLILRSFVESTNSLLAVVKGVTEDSLNNYAITVHGIKGSSRSICADVTGNMAEGLEKAARAGDFNYICVNNPDFIKAVEELIAQIDDLLYKTDSENPKTQKDKPDSGVLSKLLDACKKYDMDGVDEAMAEIESFEYESDEGLSAWLRTNVDHMNFMQIEEKLSALIGSMEEGNGN